jgi:acetyltransferase-like isoleucine patch superfamily enzyme
VREALATWIARRRLKRCSSVGAAPRVAGEVHIHGEGSVVVGDGVVFDAASAPIELQAHRGATIVLGDECQIDGGASIVSTRSIRVGVRCRLGAFCKIMDSHFHVLRGNRHEDGFDGVSVVLGDGVILAPHAIVLAGAHVGDRTYVGAATVVRRRVPAGLLVQGNPATVQARARAGRSA